MPPYADEGMACAWPTATPRHSPFLSENWWKGEGCSDSNLWSYATPWGDGIFFFFWFSCGKLFSIGIRFPAPRPFFCLGSQHELALSSLLPHPILLTHFWITWYHLTRNLTLNKGKKIVTYRVPSICRLFVINLSWHSAFNRYMH